MVTYRPGICVKHFLPLSQKNSPELNDMKRAKLYKIDQYGNTGCGVFKRGVQN